MTIDDLNLIEVNELKMSVSMMNNFVLYKIVGSMDTYNSEISGKNIINGLDVTDSNGIILDMSGVNYMSSTGIGALTNALKESHNKKKKFFLYKMQPRVFEVVELLGFTSFFSIIDDFENIKDDKTLFPLSIKCPNCGIALKVPRAGKFKCTSCKESLSVNNLGEVSASTF